MDPGAYHHWPAELLRRLHHKEALRSGRHRTVPFPERETLGYQLLRQNHAGIDENCAWEKAMENLCADTQITSLTKLLSDMSGVPFDTPAEPDINLHVITNSEKYKGAAAIMNRKALRSFACEHHTNMLFVLPSSVHEMMISPFTKETTADELSAIVREVNETQVAPEERLADRAYILCL